MQIVLDESVVKHGQPFINSELKMSPLDHGLELSIKVLHFCFLGCDSSICAFENLIVVHYKNFFWVAIVTDVEHFSIKFLSVIFVVRLCFSHLKLHMIQMFCMVSWIFIIC